MKKISAVTLLELLIASAISLVVILTVYSAFQAGMLGYRNIEEAVNTYQNARQILERINLDLRNSFAYSEGETKFTGDKNDIGFMALVDVFDKEEVTQDYAFVFYKLEGNKLMRLCRKNKEGLNDKSESEPEEMSFDIEEMVFNYGHMPVPEEGVKFDKDSWDDKTKFPLAVKVKLTLKNKISQSLERTIYLPLAQ